MFYLQLQKIKSIDFKGSIGFFSFSLWKSYRKIVNHWCTKTLNMINMIPNLIKMIVSWDSSQVWACHRHRLSLGSLLKCHTPPPPPPPTYQDHKLIEASWLKISSLKCLHSVIIPGLKRIVLWLCWDDWQVHSTARLMLIDKTQIGKS